MPSLDFNFTTDHHFSHRPPGRRQGDYMVDLSIKMNQVSAHCNAAGAIPLFGGDLFHLKDPAKIATLTMLKFLSGMSSLITKFDTKPLCAIGNHDIRWDRLDTLPEQPLGLLATSGVLDLLCPFNPGNLTPWVSPSGFTYLVENVLSGRCFPTGEGSFVYVYSTPYMEDPRDLLAYLESNPFHDALGKFVQASVPPSVTRQSVSGILLLHTLADVQGGNFYGLKRAAYPEIHTALSKSLLGRATSAVLFGHEHPEGPDYVLPLDQDPTFINNLPPNSCIATTGTIYLNPASFSRSALDYHEYQEDPERPVYMLDLVYTPNGNGLSLNVTKNFITPRPITQLFGVSTDMEPLNQEADPKPTPKVEAPVWTSFTDALTKLDNTEVNPETYLSQRLATETPQTAETVKILINPQ